MLISIYNVYKFYIRQTIDDQLLKDFLLAGVGNSGPRDPSIQVDLEGQRFPHLS